MKKKKTGQIFIILGIVLFLFRYIPFYYYNKGIYSQWMSLDNLNGFCSSFLGTIISGCNIVKPLNIIFIIVPVLLILYGIYIIYNLKRK